MNHAIIYYVTLLLAILNTCVALSFETPGHKRKACHHEQLSRRRAIKSIATSTIGLAPSLLINSQPVIASIKDPKTGILLPEVGEIEGAFTATWDDDDNPFISMGKEGFARLDSADDSVFYTDPRFVEHVDENAVKAMTSYISDRFLERGDTVLDLCSSWTSHITVQSKDRLELKRIAGLGMNSKELSSNPVLTDWDVLDLNKDSVRLPYEDSIFDKVICQLSIDYLTRPLDVMREVGRVLKPGGRVAILFSNRLFIQKAIGLWTGADDIDHAYTVGAYLHYSRGGFGDIKAEDLSSRKGKLIVGDPLYVVTAVRR